MKSASWVTDLVGNLVSQYGVPNIDVVIGCETQCPSGSICSLGGCFHHIPMFIGVKRDNVHPYIIAHEVGHYVNHYKNSFHPFSSEHCDWGSWGSKCEEFADSVAQLWKQDYVEWKRGQFLHVNPTKSWLPLLATTTFGFSLAIWAIWEGSKR